MRVSLIVLRRESDPESEVSPSEVGGIDSKEKF